MKKRTVFFKFMGFFPFSSILGVEGLSKEWRRAVLRDVFGFCIMLCG